MTTAPAPENPEMVIRKIGDKITIFSVPFARGGMIPFGGRSTAITLESKTTFLIPSHPLTPETLKTLQALPPVEHLVVPDLEHNMYVKQYATAFPTAKLYLPKPVFDKGGWEGKSVHVFGEGKPDPFPACTGGEIESVDFGKSFANQDIAFFHKPTKTLVEADLLFNLPPTEQYSQSDKTSHIALFTSGMRPGAKAHQRFLWHLLCKDKPVMTECAKKVAAWDFTRIIPCHGDVIETGGKEAWTSTYAWFLEN